ncbi:MAG: hypothetical protein M1817_003940 [Caeruleum heppii]|nr:MAG: hypothetical protein M1817_003940 [Caeruleum heppii]
MSSDDFTPVSSPPPRVAARFCRPSNNRRRSSAASSRRTSLSSTHSHHSQHSQHSHRSYHGLHSNHVAQHLRRASIIESRKARLADRAAHAEQVRLRAATAKSALRPSNSEERALAAQHARERYLAQVTAACAEEVKRAKKVAEDMKERREMENQKLRDEMEEKLAEAEKRRLEYKRNLKKSRTSSVCRGEDKTLEAKEIRVISQEEAATIIQRVWTARARRRTVQDFLALDMSIERLSNTTFEGLGAMILEERVQRCASRVLRMFGIYESTASPEEKSTVRIFLSAFLILAYPTELLSVNSMHEVHEDPLVKTATTLWTTLDQEVSCLAPSRQCIPSPKAKRELSQAYMRFSFAFTSWKTHDESLLISNMLAQYVALDHIWQKIKDDTEEVVKADYKEGIRYNQTIVMVGIKRLAGPERAKSLIKEAVRTSRRKIARDVRASRPRSANMDANADGRPAPVTSPVPADDVSPIPAAGTSSQNDSLSQLMSPLPSNRVLVHELALHRSYRLDTTSILNSPLRLRLRYQVFDQMRKDVQAGWGNPWIVAMAQIVRETLLRLLTPGNSLHVLISEVLDTAVIERECEAGTFSYERFFGFMRSMLPRLCAPFRDAEIHAALSEEGSGDAIQRLERVLHVVDMLSLDSANHLLSESAGYLVEEAPGYEHRRFAEGLQTGPISLRRTTKWWREARDKVVYEIRRRDPENVDHPAHRPTSEKIYYYALMETFVFPFALDKDDIPETLAMDSDRIYKVRDETLLVVTIGSILLTAKNLLKRDVRVPWKAQATKIWDLLSSAISNGVTSLDKAGLPQQLLAIIEAAHNMPPHSRTHLLTTTTRLLSQAAQRQVTDPVPRLLLHRLMMLVLSRLNASASATFTAPSSSSSSSSPSTPASKPAPSLTAADQLARAGVPEFGDRVADWILLLRRVGDVDRAAHGKWYEEIAGRME